MSKLEIGNQLFLYGIFFLPSTSLIGISLLFGALIISLKKFNASWREDRWNYPILVSIGLMILSTLNITIFNNPYDLKNFNSQIIWLNLLKWLILIICFYGFQNFLADNNQRKLFAKFLIAGTIPVIISCFLQKLFWDDGPYQILNGLIIWFQKPIEISGGISGLFSNVNYTGIWLCLGLPFCVVLKRLEKIKLNKILLAIFILLFSYFILETNSRNAYLSFIICLTLIMKLSYSLILIFFHFLYIIFLKFFDTSKIDLLGITNLSLFQTIKNISSTIIDPENSRFIIFKEALSLIKDRPLFGWGPSTFNFNFTNNNLNDANILSQNPYHTHNMPLELAYNFGIPVSLIIILTISILLFLSIKKLNKIRFNKEDFLINKAWIISTLIIVITHLNDVTYYEDRIGIVITILFSGLRCFIKENKIPISH